MNDLCVEIGYNSINHVGEELCGDHVEVVGQGEDSSVLVLADGVIGTMMEPVELPEMKSDAEIAAIKDSKKKGE